MDQESNIISFSNAKSADIIQGTPVEKTSRKRDNKGGGEPPMDKDKYVTHEELGHAIEMKIPYEVICDYFADTSVNLMELYGKIGEYDANQMNLQKSEPQVEEETSFDEKEMISEPSATSLQEDVTTRERIKVEVTNDKKEESSQVALFDSFVKVMSLKNKDMSNLYESQDHINKLAAQCQLLLTEMLTYTTEIIRQW